MMRWEWFSISEPWIRRGSQPTGWESWMMPTVWGRENSLGKIGSATCSSKTRSFLLRAHLPRAARPWAVAWSTKGNGGLAYVPSSGQMTFGQSLSFLSTGFLITKIGTIVSKHHGVDAAGIKEVIHRQN